MLLRLDKLLSSQGTASRSESQRIIRSGRVAVDGRVCRDPAVKVDPGQTGVTVDGRALSYRRHVFLMMNKPAGWLCVSRDPQAPTVLELLPGEWRRPGLFPAGRLDKDTVGLVIITDDGDFAHRMLSPRKEIVKRYHAVVDGPVTPAMREAFAAGTSLADGTLCRPAGLSVLKEGEHPLTEVSVTEGRFHQVKRMFLSVGRRVLWLKRVSVGALVLDDSLKEGESRFLTEEETGAVFQ